MRAWRVHRFGEPADVLELEESIESPTPGPDQLKIRVDACGLGLPDVLMCQNNYPLVPPLPFTPSQEAAGEVIAVGAHGDPALIGTRVLGPTLFQAGCGGLAQECLLIAPMALDGFTQLFGFRESTWELRVVTGTLFGIASVWLIYPHLQTGMAEMAAVLERRFQRQERRRPSTREAVLGALAFPVQQQGSE